MRQLSCYNEFMRTFISRISRFLLILIFFSAVSLANAAAKPGGRLIVIRVANFGWNLAASLKIDGQTVANIVQGRRYDHRIPSGRHVLTISAVPNIQLSQPTSITVNVRPGGTYIFTALWDSDQVYLRPTTLSPAEMAWDFEKRYLIFARIPSISFRRNARKVWPLTLPSEPTLRMNALMVSSSGASIMTTAS